MHQDGNATLALWNEQAELVEALLRQPGSHPFMQKLCACLGLPEDGYADFVRRHQTAFKSSLMSNRRNALPKAGIPAITHRIWLTSAVSPRHPPSDYIDSLLKSNLALPAHATHYFWTNNPVVSVALRAKAAALGCYNVILVDITLFARESVMARVESLIAANKFVLAADIFKFMVLERFGGIYGDLGVLYDSEIFNLIQTADYALIVTDSVFFQTSFIASAPQADLTNMFLAVMNVPSALDPVYAMLGPTVTGLDEVHVFAGFGLTACAMLFLPRLARVLMLPGQSRHLQSRSEQSWYGVQPKHGNVLVAETAPTLISDVELQRSGELFGSHVQTYGFDPILRARLRVLVNVAGYFADHPTQVCQTFLFHGSDKALGWHNYGFVYSFLLGTLKSEVQNILEVGIGTPHPDVLSTMGVGGVPGASLRAWRESFPGATVVGADIDIRVLFQEPRVETYWVDQTRSEAVQNLFTNIGKRKFDLIIDDGLHTFAANRTMMLEAYGHLTSEGCYIIEDVADEAVAAWHDYLSSVGCTAAMVRIPHATNQQDNRLIFIPGGQTHCFPNAQTIRDEELQRSWRSAYEDNPYVFVR